MRHWVTQPRPIDVRHVGLPTFFGGAAREGQNLVWMRVPRELDADPALHQRLLAYMSDLTLLDNIVLPHGRNGSLGPVMVASIDHALWFHRVPRVDEWLLYVQDSPAAAGARGFARGTLFAQRRHPRRVGRAGRVAAASSSRRGSQRVETAAHALRFSSRRQLASKRPA